MRFPRLASVPNVAVALAIALSGVGAASCQKQEARTALSYTADAKRAYDEAMEEFRAKNWIEAQALFREVKRKYGYSKYARLAELRLADADFEQEKYADAIRGFKQFVHDHRSDSDDVAYARSKIAEGQYREIGDSFLLPASEERDQAAVLDAYKELRSYLQDYPDAKESRRVRELLSEVTGRLVRHELSVARFYLARDNFEAAVARIRYALVHYSVRGAAAVTSLFAPAGMASPFATPPSGGAEPEHAGGPGAGPRRSRGGAPAAPASSGLDTPVVDSGLEPDALILLGETYLKMHRWTDARGAFETILRDYPQSGLIVPARKYLDELHARGV